MKRRAGRGALVILALFLASSGALRIGVDVGAAMANSTEAAVETPKPQSCPEPPAALAKALQTRESEVRAQEVAVEDRLAALALAEEAISKRMAELTAAEDDLKKTLQIADGAAEADLTRLTAVYEAMKPADAAQVFAAMAPDFAAGFLGRMRAESAAAVMAGMTPEQAYSISVLIAGRNALAPTK
jgi:flagellar motility protein MotE (MotC chaperone)